MYKIVNITDRKGNVKQEFIDEMKSVHLNLSGDILYPELTKVGGHFCFVWNDDTDKMLRTSTIEEYENNDDTVKVVTRNSIYYFEKENIKIDSLTSLPTYRLSTHITTRKSLR